MFCVSQGWRAVVLGVWWEDTENPPPSWVRPPAVELGWTVYMGFGRGGRKPPSEQSGLPDGCGWPGTQSLRDSPRWEPEVGARCSFC